MDTYTSISIAISLIAVFVSIASYMTNKAINNHMQLQNSYIELCKKLQKLIELLLEKWYVSRYEEELLYSDICDISEKKEEERK